MASLSQRTGPTTQVTIMPAASPTTNALQPPSFRSNINGPLRRIADGLQDWVSRVLPHSRSRKGVATNEACGDRDAVKMTMTLVFTAVLLVVFLVWDRSATPASQEAVSILSSLPSEVLNPRVRDGPSGSIYSLHKSERGDVQRSHTSDSSDEAAAVRVWPQDPGAPLPWRPRYPWRGFFIALNLFNNAAVLPTLTTQLVRFLKEEIMPFFDLTERVFISVFSNGSSDSTEADILNLLVPALLDAGVPQQQMHIVVNGTCCEGKSRRPADMDRIEWMACVRNAAMLPWYHEGVGLFSHQRRGFVDAPVAAAEVQSVPVGFSVTLRDGSRLTSDDVAVLFFNDIFFAPGDITALLETNYVNTRSFEARVHTFGLSASPGGNVTTYRTLAELPQVQYSKLWDGFDLACGMDYYVAMYDVWVTRGVDGRAFDGFPPYAADSESRAIFSASNRIGPVDASNHLHVAMRVRSCWNGVAAIRGSFFTEYGIRFRRPGSTMFNMSRDERNGGCYDSECLLIGKDIMRAAMTGKSHVNSGTPFVVATPREAQIFLNPHVKVAYEADSYALHKQHWFVASRWYYPTISWIRFTTWNLFGDNFSPPTRTDPDGTQRIDTMWTECLLPADTLPPIKAVIGWCVVVCVAVAAVRFGLAQQVRRVVVTSLRGWRKRNLLATNSAHRSRDDATAIDVSSGRSSLRSRVVDVNSCV